MQQIGERRADRLPCVTLGVEKARAGIYLEAKELALGSLLQVDPGEEEIERVGETQARRFHCPWQGDRLEIGGKAVGMIRVAKTRSPTVCTRTLWPGTNAWNCAGPSHSRSRRARWSGPRRRTIERMPLADL